MQALIIVKLEVGRQSGEQVGHSRTRSVHQIDVLILDRTPEPPDEDIVQRAAASIHADADPGAFQRLCKLTGGELDPLIGIEDIGMPVLQTGLQGLTTELPIQGVGHLPGYHVATEPVQNGHQIHKPLEHRQVRDIRTPYLIRMHVELALSTLACGLVSGVNYSRNKLTEGGDGGIWIRDRERKSLHWAGAVITLIEDKWNETTVLEWNVILGQRITRGLTGERRINRSETRRAGNHRYRLAHDFIGQRGVARLIAQCVDGLQQFADARACSSSQDCAILRKHERERIGVQSLFG